MRRFCVATDRLFRNRFDRGGEMNNDKVSQSKPSEDGVTVFNKGGSHEENINGGIPQGVAPDGSPNLVEQGEVKLGDVLGMDNQYILSNRIVIDAEHAKAFGIDPSVVGMTYAAGFRKLYDRLKDRKGNIEVRNEIAHLANNFQSSQDSVKDEQLAKQMEAMLSKLSPEQLQQLMALQQGAVQQQQPQQGMEQQMPHQGMEQQQMQQDPMAMQQQGMPQDPMAMQNGMPQQGMGQMPMPQGGTPMMAKGGDLKTINNKNKDKGMFNNIFRKQNRFDNGGAMPVAAGEGEGMPAGYEPYGAEANGNSMPKGGDLESQRFNEVQAIVMQMPLEELVQAVLAGQLGEGEQLRLLLGERYEEVMQAIEQQQQAEQNAANEQAMADQLYGAGGDMSNEQVSAGGEEEIPSDGVFDSIPQ